MAADVGYGGASGKELGSFLVFLPMRVDGSGIVSHGDEARKRGKGGMSRRWAAARASQYHPFQTVASDHAETPTAAYADLVAFLSGVEAAAARRVADHEAEAHRQIPTRGFAAFPGSLLAAGQVRRW